MKKWLGCFLCSCAFLLAFTACGKPQESLTVYYVHDNPCASCHPFQEFTEWFKDEAVTDDTELQYAELNLFYQGVQGRFEVMCEDLGIEEGNRLPPLLIIGNGYLRGEEEIREGAAELLRDEQKRGEKSHPKGQAPKPTPKPVFDWDQKYPRTDPNVSTLLCFVTTACEDCGKVKDYFKSLPKSVLVNKDGAEIASQVEILQVNVSEPEGIELAQRYFTQYQVPQNEQKVPIVFFRGGYLQGAKNIISESEQAMKDGHGLDFKFAKPVGAKALTPENLVFVFLAGLVGGVNPCSISMLLLLLSLLFAKKERVLPLGLAYLASKFITYLCIGFFLYFMLQVLETEVFGVVQAAMKYLLAGLAFLLAAGYLWDFWNAHRQRYQNIKMQLPTSLRRWNQHVIEHAAAVKRLWVLVLAVFFLGAIVSAGEFLCTGQVYLATILYLMEAGSTLDSLTVIAFVCYVFGSVIPSAVLTFLVYRGKRALELSEFTRKRLPLIKLVTGLLFLLCGVLAILYY